MAGICWNPRSVVAENAICRTCLHLTSPPEVANEKQRRRKEIQTRLLLPRSLPKELSIITTRCAATVPGCVRDCRKGVGSCDPREFILNVRVHDELLFRSVFKRRKQRLMNLLRKEM